MMKMRTNKKNINIIRIYATEDSKPEKDKEYFWWRTTIKFFFKNWKNVKKCIKKEQIRKTIFK